MEYGHRAVTCRWRASDVGFTPILELDVRLIVLTVLDLHASGMALLPPITLSDGDKLEVLRRLDQFRKWSSLEEKRYCLVCANIITGREIQIIGGSRGMGALRMICPSRGCHSIPMDWVRPTDEVLANMSMLQGEPNDGR